MNRLFAIAGWFINTNYLLLIPWSSQCRYLLIVRFDIIISLQSVFSQLLCIRLFEGHLTPLCLTWINRRVSWLQSHLSSPLCFRSRCNQHLFDWLESINLELSVKWITNSFHWRCHFLPSSFTCFHVQHIYHWSQFLSLLFIFSEMCTSFYS